MVETPTVLLRNVRLASPSSYCNIHFTHVVLLEVASLIEIYVYFTDIGMIVLCTNLNSFPFFGVHSINRIQFILVCGMVQDNPLFCGLNG